MLGRSTDLSYLWYGAWAKRVSRSMLDTYMGTVERVDGCNTKELRERTKCFAEKVIGKVGLEAKGQGHVMSWPSHRAPLHKSRRQIWGSTSSNLQRANDTKEVLNTASNCYFAIIQHQSSTYLSHHRDILCPASISHPTTSPAIYSYADLKTSIKQPIPTTMAASTPSMIINLPPPRPDDAATPNDLP
jgi:hypothetical protein